jgi:hypothetical protein
MNKDILFLVATNRMEWKPPILHGARYAVFDHLITIQHKSPFQSKCCSAGYHHSFSSLLARVNKGLVELRRMPYRTVYSECRLQLLRKPCCHGSLDVANSLNDFSGSSIIGLINGNCKISLRQTQNPKPKLAHDTLLPSRTSHAPRCQQHSPQFIFSSTLLPYRYGNGKTIVSHRVKITMPILEQIENKFNIGARPVHHN